MKRLWSMTALLACAGGGVTQSIDLSHLDDVDEDGHPVETDCDDNNASVYPGADEICDGLDNDCDGFIDTADEDAVGLLTGYTDADGDGYGAMDAELSDCELPESSVEIGGDCDDADASVHPGASESCSTTADDDCSGTVNDPDALGCSDWFIDDDGDGHGSGEALCLCFGEGSYSSASDADCDDTDPDTHPDAIEICDDGWDHDCDESAEACRLTDSYDIEDAPLYLQGTEAGAQLGLHLALADDLSGDGYSDLLVHGLSTEALLWVVEASGHGDVPLSPSNTLQPSAGLTSIDSAWGADLSGDGVADLVVGSEAEGGDAGTVAIFLGPLPESFDLSSAWKIWTGEPGDRIGETAWLGDLRGSGEPFLAIGAPGNGGLYLAAGSATEGLSLPTAAQWIDGQADVVAPGGDTNGDGLQDFAVAHSEGADGGTVYLLAGPAEQGALSDADAVLSAESSADRFGAALAGVGDVNGDGLDDILIGAPDHSSSGTQAGAAWLFAGPLEGPLSPDDAIARFDGVAAKDRSGTAVSGAGDLDGDGYAELAISAPDNDEGSSSAGMVGLYYGPISGTHDLDRADAVFIGESAEDHAGQTLLGGDDLDGNGRPDLIIGVPGEDDGAMNGGGAALWTGLGY